MTVRGGHALQHPPSCGSALLKPSAAFLLRRHVPSEHAPCPCSSCTYLDWLGRPPPRLPRPGRKVSIIVRVSGTLVHSCRVAGDMAVAIGMVPPRIAGTLPSFGICVRKTARISLITDLSMFSGTEVLRAESQWQECSRFTLGVSRRGIPLRAVRCPMPLQARFSRSARDRRQYDGGGGQ